MARNTIIVGGRRIHVPGGVEVITWEEGGTRFPAQHMRAAETVTEITLHETVTETISGMVAAFRRGGGTLGTHFAADPVTGTIHQFADPAYHVLYHAAGHNRQGVGIDIVNPYYPEAAKRIDGRPVIAAPWADRGRNQVRDYIVPRPAPLESVWRLIVALTSTEAGLSVPVAFPGLIGSDKLAMTQVDHGNQRIPGIWAHGQQFSMGKDGKRKAHADGYFPLLYMALRQRGAEPAQAYAQAMALAQTGKRITLPAARQDGAMALAS